MAVFFSSESVTTWPFPLARKKFLCQTRSNDAYKAIQGNFWKVLAFIESQNRLSELFPWGSHFLPLTQWLTIRIGSWPSVTLEIMRYRWTRGKESILVCYALSLYWYRGDIHDFLVPRKASTNKGYAAGDIVRWKIMKIVYKIWKFVA